MATGADVFLFMTGVVSFLADIFKFFTIAFAGLAFYARYPAILLLSFVVVVDILYYITFDILSSGQTSFKQLAVKFLTYIFVFLIIMNLPRLSEWMISVVFYGLKDAIKAALLSAPFISGVGSKTAIYYGDVALHELLVFRHFFTNNALEVSNVGQSLTAAYGPDVAAKIQASMNGTMTELDIDFDDMFLTFFVKFVVNEFGRRITAFIQVAISSLSVSLFVPGSLTLFMFVGFAMFYSIALFVVGMVIILSVYYFALMEFMLVLAFVTILFPLLVSEPLKKFAGTNILAIFNIGLKRILVYFGMFLQLFFLLQSSEEGRSNWENSQMCEVAKGEMLSYIRVGSQEDTRKELWAFATEKEGAQVPTSETELGLVGLFPDFDYTNKADANEREKAGKIDVDVPIFSDIIHVDDATPGALDIDDRKEADFSDIVGATTDTSVVQVSSINSKRLNVQGIRSSKDVFAIIPSERILDYQMGMAMLTTNTRREKGGAWDLIKNKKNKKQSGVIASPYANVFVYDWITMVAGQIDLNENSVERLVHAFALNDTSLVNTIVNGQEVEENNRTYKVTDLSSYKLSDTYRKAVKAKKLFYTSWDDTKTVLGAPLIYQGLSTEGKRILSADRSVCVENIAGKGVTQQLGSIFQSLVYPFIFLFSVLIVMQISKISGSITSGMSSMSGSSMMSDARNVHSFAKTGGMLGAASAAQVMLRAGAMMKGGGMTAAAGFKGMASGFKGGASGKGSIGGAIAGGLKGFGGAALSQTPIGKGINSFRNMGNLGGSSGSPGTPS